MNDHNFNINALSTDTVMFMAQGYFNNNVNTLIHSGRSEDSIIMHVGQLYRSGRFPWGSGENPFQRHGNLARRIQQMQDAGLSEKERAAELGLSVPALRVRISEIKQQRQMSMMTIIPDMKEQGMSNREISRVLTEMGQEYGYKLSPQQVANYQDPKVIAKITSKNNDIEVLKEQIRKHTYVDLGAGVEQYLGITEQRLNDLVKSIGNDPEFHVYNQIQVPQASNPKQKTTIRVVSTEPDYKVVRDNIHNIMLPDGVTKEGANLKTKPEIGPPELMSRDRIQVAYDEDGGSLKDGVIEIRRGAEGLDLGNAMYAQVRIGVEGPPNAPDMYMKGMAIYVDDLPPGVDVRYNTNKKRGTADIQEHGKKGLAVFKGMEDDPQLPFGSVINKQRGHLNIIREEGDWYNWSRNLSTQFLAKQPLKLVNERLEATRTDAMNELAKINELTNPVVRQKVLEDFSGRMLSASQHMKAKAIPNQATNVIMPVPSIAQNEVYAPQHPNGTKLALVRYPHGAIFEIPELVVNNNNRVAKQLLGNAQDAVGIHPAVAEQMSGADFDGDFVVAIPNNDRRVATLPAIQEVIDFDNKQYQVPGVTFMKKGSVGTQMGMASNLITDMTVRGATQEELIRAVKHSMVVIDAHKHNLDYKRSERDHGIAELRKKYQSRIDPVTGAQKQAGAATLFSRSGDGSTIENPNWNPDKPTNNDPRSRNYNPRIISLAEWARDQKGGAANLVSLDNTEVERVYASHSNNTVAISRQAQADADNVVTRPVNRAAAREFANEVQELTRKLNRAKANKPIERMAQIRANAALRARDTEGLTDSEMKKLRTQLIRDARDAVNAESVQIEITDREWEAIQNDAISKTLLRDILSYADMDRVMELAMPRQETTFSESQMVRMRQMINQGRTWAQIAEAMNTSVATVLDTMLERNPELIEQRWEGEEN